MSNNVFTSWPFAVDNGQPQPPINEKLFALFWIEADGCSNQELVSGIDVMNGIVRRINLLITSWENCINESIDHAAGMYKARAQKEYGVLSGEPEDLKTLRDRVAEKKAKFEDALAGGQEN